MGLRLLAHHYMLSENPRKGIIGPHKGMIEPEYPHMKGPWAQGPCAI